MPTHVPPPPSLKAKQHEPPIHKAPHQSKHAHDTDRVPPASLAVAGQALGAEGLTLSAAERVKQAAPFTDQYDGPAVGVRPTDTQPAGVCLPTGALASQHPKALAAARNEISNPDDTISRERAQAEQEIHSQAVGIRSTVMTKMLECEIQLQQQSGGSSNVSIKKLTPTCYEKTYIDESGRKITEHYSMSPDGSTASINSIIHDPANKEAPYTFIHQDSTMDGHNVSARTEETKYRRSPGGLSPNYPHPFGGFGFDNLNKVSEVRKSGRTGDGGTSLHIDQTEYGRAHSSDEQDVKRSQTDIRFDEVEQKNLDIAGGSQNVFNKSDKIAKRSISHTAEHHVGYGQTSSRTIHVDDYEQGNTRLTDTSGVLGPHAISITKQLDENNRITQKSVEGESKTEVTKTTVCGNQVTAETVIYDKPSERPAQKIANATTVRSYGDDGKLRHVSTVTADLKTGEKTTEVVYREVDGNTVRYDSAKVEMKEGEQAKVTLGSGLNELGPDGSETMRERQVKTPDGDTVTVRREDGKQPTVSHTDKSGAMITGTVKPTDSDGLEIEFSDNSKNSQSNRRLTLGKDGTVDESQLTPAEQKLLPSLLTFGIDATKTGKVIAGSVQSVTDSTQFKTIAGLMKKLGADESTTGTARSFQQGFNAVSSLLKLIKGISGLSDSGPNRDRVGAALDTTSGATGLAGVASGMERFKGLSKIANHLNLASGIIDIISGINTGINAKDGFDTQEAILGVGGGTATTVLAFLAIFGEATPPGWIATAVGLATLAIKSAINYERDHYLPPTVLELRPNGGQGFVDPYGPQQRVEWDPGPYFIGL